MCGSNVYLSVAYAEICEGGFGAENTIVLSQGFPNWGTFRLLKGTLSERISLFELNSVSGRNNGLKCLEFSNPVDYNYRTGQLRGKTFLQITVILGLNGENLWLLKREEFSFSRDYLDFRHELGKLFLFFLEDTMILRQK